jgi:hypothetical protein
MENVAAEHNYEKEAIDAFNLENDRRVKLDGIMADISRAEKEKWWFVLGYKTARIEQSQNKAV